VEGSLRYLEVRREDAICVVALRREGKLNALSMQVERELLAALDLPELCESRCIVFTGSGRAFSAGADVSELRANDPAAILSYYNDTGDVYERIAALPQPTVSAISGYCLGGGLELALATDFRVADETAVFGFPEVSIGIVPSSGGLYRAVRILGTARAREWILLRRRVDAKAAHASGLLTEVVAPGQALQRSIEIANELANLPPLAVSVAKAAIDHVSESSREASLAIERLAYGMLAQTQDAREAATAFVEKRPPRFQGR
jgi:enoyl-CoA hydratase/carnithine racemase